MMQDNFGTPMNKSVIAIKTLAMLVLLVLATTAGIACSADAKVSSPPVATPAETSVPPLKPAAGQQIIIDNVMADLKQHGVPVQSARLISFNEINPPIVLEFTLQSTGDGTGGASEDPINFNLVYRTANLAQREGLNIGGIGIILIDNRGKQIMSGISAVTDINDLPPEDYILYTLDAVKLADLLRQQVFLNAPSTVDIQVNQGIDDLREVMFDINVKDIQAANDNIRIVGAISRAVHDLNNDQDARIYAYRINITDADGKPLLKLSSNFTSDSGGSISWWEAEGLENWGYPSPPPEETLISKVKDFISRLLSAIGIDTEW